MKITDEWTTKRLNQSVSNLGFELSKELGLIDPDVVKVESLLSIYLN